MKSSEIKESIKTLIAARQPGFIWGPPGVGKSDAMRQATAEMSMQLIDIRAILLDPVDLRGIPKINGDNRAHWCIPEFLPREGEGTLFLDELPAAPQLVQAACYQLVLDRKLGEYTLPDGWVVMAAGNRETDRAVSHRMSSALANRFIHLDFDVDLEDWVKWALSSGIRTEVIAFLRFKPELLHQFDPARNEKAFPTPRSWEFVSNLMQQNPSPAIEYPLIAGTVGEGAAAEFLAFLKIARQLPNPDLVIMNPDSAPVPTDPSALYAICGSVARKASQNTIGRILKYADRLPAEFSVLMMRDSINQDKDVLNTREGIEWCSKNADVLI